MWSGVHSRFWSTTTRRGSRIIPHHLICLSLVIVVHSGVSVQDTMQACLSFLNHQSSFQYQQANQNGSSESADAWTVSVASILEGIQGSTSKMVRENYTMWGSSSHPSIHSIHCEDFLLPLFLPCRTTPASQPKRHKGVMGMITFLTAVMISQVYVHMCQNS